MGRRSRAHHVSKWRAAAQLGPSTFQSIGSGPVRAIKLSVGGPRPGPIHQVFIWCAAARPTSSNYYLMGLGPARPFNSSEDRPRPCPAHPIFELSRLGPPGPAHHFSNLLARQGTTRPMMFSICSARPGLTHDIRDEGHEARALYMGRPAICEGRPVN